MARSGERSTLALDLEGLSFNPTVEYESSASVSVRSGGGERTAAAGRHGSRKRQSIAPPAVSVKVDAPRAFARTALKVFVAWAARSEHGSLKIVRRAKAPREPQGRLPHRPRMARACSVSTLREAECEHVDPPVRAERGRTVGHRTRRWAQGSARSAA